MTPATVKTKLVIAALCFLVVLAGVVGEEPNPSPADAGSLSRLAFVGAIFLEHANNIESIRARGLFPEDVAKWKTLSWACTSAVKEMQDVHSRCLRASQPEIREELKRCRAANVMLLETLRRIMEADGALAILKEARSLHSDISKFDKGLAETMAALPSPAQDSPPPKLQKL